MTWVKHQGLVQKEVTCPVFNIVLGVRITSLFLLSGACVVVTDPKHWMNKLTHACTHVCMCVRRRETKKQRRLQKR